jgi:hypothetical protein
MAFKQEIGRPLDEAGTFPETSETRKRKQYKSPAFRYERVFETMALACGKMNNGIPHCNHMKSAS